MDNPPINEEEIFQVAAALPSGDRTEYLDAACGDDLAVRARMERLLASHEESGFMPAPLVEQNSELEKIMNLLKPEESGERIGPYKLLQPLGEGGFGTVWMADQMEPVKRRVALKIIKMGMDTKEVIARFEQERQALAMMDHPNIAKVFDAGATQYGRPYFVMELVRGVPITAYCDERKLSVAERLALFIDVCHALQHAHQKGIIHRDLKPSNLLVTAGDGDAPVPKIIDFGVAKAMDRALTDKTLFTQFDQMIGTPAYMSPEQAGAGPMDIDTRSDIYSLGVVLYEMLTGKPPFDPMDLHRAGHEEMRRVIREQEPPRPSTRLSTLQEVDLTGIAAGRHVEPGKLAAIVRGDLDWIVMKALEKDRTRRYETANGLAMDIQRHLASEPVLARPPSVGYQVQKFVRRNRLAVFSSAAVALALFIGIVLSTREAGRAQRAERLAEIRLDEVGTEKEAKDQALKKSREQLRLMSRSDQAVAQNHFLNNQWSEGIAYLGRAIQNDPDNQPAKKHLWSALINEQGQRDPLPELILSHGALVRMASFSANGRRILTASHDKTAQIWDTGSGQAIGAAMIHGGQVYAAIFNSDGTRVVTGSEDKTARIWDAATGQPIGVPMQHDGLVVSVNFSPDGTRIVTASEDKSARIWDAFNGQPVTAPLVHEGGVESACFNSDGTQVVTASRDKTAHLWDAKSGQPVGIPLRHRSVIWYVSYSPDGTRVVTASGDGTGQIWDVASGKPVGATLQHNDQVWTAKFSPDGTRVLTASDDKTARMWDAATGLAIGNPMRHDDQIRPGASFSSDGTRVITASFDKTARIWDAASGQPIGLPMRHDAPLWDASFSAGGTRIVTAGFDKTARIWDAASGSPAGVPMRHRGAVRSATFSHDGTRIITASADGAARLWAEANGLSLGVLIRHRGPVWDASFSPDDTRVVTASLDKTARIWNAANGQAVGKPLQHDAQVVSASFSADGRRVVTASGVTARIWDAISGQLVGIPMKHEGGIVTASFSSDGKRVVTSSYDKTARIWDADSGKPIGIPLRHQAPLCSASFSPDGKRVVTCSFDDTAALLWDTASSRLVGPPLQHDAPVWSASFSMDGTRVVTASSDKTSRIWDVASGRQVGPPLRYNGSVRSASFSPDGSRVVTASEDGTARVWDASSGQPVGVPLHHEKTVWSANFSPNGSRIVTASEDGTARLWETESGAPVEIYALDTLIGAVAGRQFSADGVLDVLSGSQRVALRDRLILEADGNREASKTVRWLLASAEGRTVGPAVTTTVRDLAGREIASGIPAAIRQARSYDPGNPLIQIALASLETNATRGEFLRKYGLDHLLPDPKLWMRAAEMLLDQRQFPLAARAVNRVAQLDPPSATELQSRLHKLQDTASAAQAPKAPKRFRFMYSFDDPGYRQWTRKDAQWEERQPSGKVNVFDITGRDEADGKAGTVLQRKGTDSSKILICDRDVADPGVYIRGSQGEWDRLGKMEDVE